MFITRDEELISDFLHARDLYELAVSGTVEEEQALSHLKELGKKLSLSEREARLERQQKDREELIAFISAPFEERIEQRTVRHNHIIAHAVTEAGKELEMRNFTTTCEKIRDKRDRALEKALHSFDKISEHYL